MCVWSFVSILDSNIESNCDVKLSFSNMLGGFCEFLVRLFRCSSRVAFLDVSSLICSVKVPTWCCRLSS